VKQSQYKKVVLAYSGGLDTSVILGWLMDEGYDVHAVYVDLGQPCEDRDATLAKARTCGAKSARIVDAREELCRDFAFPVLQWQAKYEGIYLLGTSIARPLITKACLQVAREVGANAFAHGATGKGNDQCRFQLAAEALDQAVRVIAPWRMEKFRAQFPGRREMIASLRSGLARPAEARIAPTRAAVPELATTSPPRGKRSVWARRRSSWSESGPWLE
jgi:argininosuccinate synthase